MASLALVYSVHARSNNSWCHCAWFHLAHHSCVIHMTQHSAWCVLSMLSCFVSGFCPFFFLSFFYWCEYEIHPAIYHRSAHTVCVCVRYSMCHRYKSDKFTSFGARGKQRWATSCGRDGRRKGRKNVCAFAVFSEYFIRSECEHQNKLFERKQSCMPRCEMPPGQCDEVVPSCCHVHFIQNHIFIPLEWMRIGRPAMVSVRRQWSVRHFAMLSNWVCDFIIAFIWWKWHNSLYKQ